MSKGKRDKTDDSIYHVMCRSISEVDLFKDNYDKDSYIGYVKKYQCLYKFKIYGYCLMDNHAHFVIDSNGSDISKIMHAINFSYAQHFNRRHKRHGHLFQDRFKSKRVTNDTYLYILSAYIHNNPVDIKDFASCPENYEYSSLAAYIGLRADKYGILDIDFILHMLGDNIETARKSYIKFVYKCDNKVFKEKETELKNQPTEYKSGRSILVRNFKREDVLDYVCEKMNVKRGMLYSKGRRESVRAKALLVYLMRSLCNFNCYQICQVLGNISQVRVSTLSTLAINMMCEDKEFNADIEEFIERYSA